MLACTVARGTQTLAYLLGRLSPGCLALGLHISSIGWGLARVEPRFMCFMWWLHFLHNNACTDMSRTCPRRSLTREQSGGPACSTLHWQWTRVLSPIRCTLCVFVPMYAFELMIDSCGLRGTSWVVVGDVSGRCVGISSVLLGVCGSCFAMWCAASGCWKGLPVGLRVCARAVVVRCVMFVHVCPAQLSVKRRTWNGRFNRMTSIHWLLG